MLFGKCQAPRGVMGWDAASTCHRRDRSAASYGREAYVGMYREQLRELLTGSGPIGKSGMTATMASAVAPERSGRSTEGPATMR